MIWFVMLALTLWVLGIVVAVSGSVDAASQPRELWAATGERRIVWLWQAVAVVAVPVALVYSGLYFLRVRPKLIKAGVLTNADADWADRLRWYDRFNSARRSPAKWAQAARRWWVWLVLIGVAAGCFAEQLVGFGRHDSYAPRPAWIAVLAGMWAVIGLTAAARAGFWYAEHMRLTGRRPASGGPLQPRARQAGAPGVIASSGP